MRLPRDWGGDKLAKVLKRYGYEITRQSGSHMRLTTQQDAPLRVGTLNAILKSVARHLGLERDELLAELTGQSRH
jgi:predicted RNA binding protein YcfA (HicA-like mRNA interferase family)